MRTRSHCTVKGSGAEQRKGTSTRYIKRPECVTGGGRGGATMGGANLIGQRRIARPALKSRQERPSGQGQREPAGLGS